MGFASFHIRPFRFYIPDSSNCVQVIKRAYLLLICAHVRTRYFIGYTRFDFEICQYTIFTNN